MKPSIGRIVHVQGLKRRADGSNVDAAIVTGVYSRTSLTDTELKVKQAQEFDQNNSKKDAGKSAVDVEQTKLNADQQKLDQERAESEKSGMIAKIDCTLFIHGGKTVALESVPFFETQKAAEAHPGYDGSTNGVNGLVAFWPERVLDDTGYVNSKPLPVAKVSWLKT